MIETEFESRPLTRLDAAMARAVQEQATLEAELRDIFSRARCLRYEKAPRFAQPDLEKLNVCVKRFMEQWKSHLQWEEAELYPQAVRYLEAQADLFGYTGITDAIAERLMQSYLTAAERMTEATVRDEAGRIASYLLQMYPILKNRLDEEAELTAALADRSSRCDC